MIYGVSERPCSDNRIANRWYCKCLAHGQQVGNVDGLGYEHLDAKAAVVNQEHHLVVPGVFIQDFKRLVVAGLVEADAGPLVGQDVEADLGIQHGKAVARLHDEEIAQHIGVVWIVFAQGCNGLLHQSA